MTMVMNERLSRLAALLCGAMAAVASVAAAAEPWGDVRPRPQDFLGSLSCSSASCHGGAEIWGPTGLVGHHEYVRWIGTEAKYADGRRGYDPRAQLVSSNADPHALAAWRMTQSRFQEVLHKASLRSDGTTDETMNLRCAACHDPLGLATGIDSPRNEVDKKLVSLNPPNLKPHPPAHAEEEKELPHEPVAMRGISCESCHGGAAKWIATHFRRDVSRESLAKQGMIDTKNLLLRARQCAACHVGSAEQDMNHDMIAAGHPPLRFEQASYEALLAGKHWNDAPQRTANPNYEVQLWAAGRIAAAEAALELLEERAKQAGNKRSWPEFAESNCFACHQPLRSLEGRTTEVGAYRTRVTRIAPWQTWNTALVTSLIVGEPAGEFDKALDALRTAMEKSFEPSAPDIAEKAATARKLLQAAVRIDANGRVLDRHDCPLDVDAVLTAGKASNSVSWDEACQRVAVLAAASRSLRDSNRFVALRDGVQNDWLDQMGRISRSLRFTRPDREWPAVLTSDSSMAVLKMDVVGQELEALRAQLVEMCKKR